MILALVVFPEDVPSGIGISTGRGFGYWASLVFIIAGVVLSVLRLKATGGQAAVGEGSGRARSATARRRRRPATRPSESASE